ncbi:unnamed protein product [Brassica rapa subsp. narinosa]
MFENLEDLSSLLNRIKRNWFENPPQFKHIFHMPKDGNYKLIGMWMLML